MSNETILIVEDDIDLSGIMRDFLVNEGFQVIQAFHGEEGIDLALASSPSLIVLDIMLPKADGIEVCKSIRKASFAPIIIISAKNSDMDKLLTLGVGADDYLTKPFSVIELVARIKAHIRRFTSFTSDPAPNSSLQKKVFGELVVYPKSYNVYAGETKIPLTSREFKLLDFMTSNPSQVFSKEQLAEKIWGFHEFIDDNTIAVYIGRLREKLKKQDVCYIKTVWGVGYKWEYDN